MNGICHNIIYIIIVYTYTIKIPSCHRIYINIIIFLTHVGGSNFDFRIACNKYTTTQKENGFNPFSFHTTNILEGGFIETMKRVLLSTRYISHSLKLCVCHRHLQGRAYLHNHKRIYFCAYP